MALDRQGRDVTLVLAESRYVGEYRYAIVVNSRIEGYLDYVPGGETVTGINILDSIERQNGIARAALKELFALYPETAVINGDSVPGAHRFWEGVGCEWQDGRDDEHCSLFELSREALKTRGIS